VIAMERRSTLISVLFILCCLATVGFSTVTLVAMYRLLPDAIAHAAR